jgi:hypothetical protein
VAAAVVFTCSQLFGGMFKPTYKATQTTQTTQPELSLSLFLAGQAKKKKQDGESRNCPASETTTTTKTTKQTTTITPKSEPRHEQEPFVTKTNLI